MTLENELPENRVFSSRLAFALNRYHEVNRFHLENGAELRRSPNFAIKAIGILGPLCHMALAYSPLGLVAILVAMEDAEYSEKRGGYVGSTFNLDRDPTESNEAVQ